MRTVFFLISACIIFSSHLFSQHVVNIDSLYERAAFYSKNQELNKAIQLCDSIIKYSQLHYDALLLRARIYSWKKEWLRSEADLQIIISNKPEHQEAWMMYATIGLWSGNYKKLVTVSSNALDKYPRNEFFLYKMAQAYYHLKLYDDAKKYIDQLLSVNDAHTEALILKKRLKEEGAKNKIMLSNEHSYFSKTFSPWHSYSVEYSRRVSKTSVIPRINYYRRFGDADWQFETDAYPRFGKMYYAYLNAGISGNILFPKYRFGIELYRKLPFAMEASIGYRNLVFNTNVSIFTGYIGKYWKNYWFCYRPFITPKDNGTSLSNTILIRRYLSSAQEYISLGFSNGFSPDDLQKQILFSSATNLTSYKGGITLQKKLFPLLYVKGEYNYEYFESSDSNFISKNTFNAGIFTLF